MDRHPAANLVTALAAALLIGTSCAASASPTQQQQSTAGHIVTATSGSRGSVYFVSDQVGWVLTIPPDSLRMVVFRTSDGGRHWQLWGIAPEVAETVGFSVNEVVLHGRGCPDRCDDFGVLRSNDGTRWTFAPTPTQDMPFFLPDLQHGWIVGLLPEPPCTTCVPQAKGGPATPAPPPLCAVWYTANGGATWTMRTQGNFGDMGARTTFWNQSDGLLSGNSNGTIQPLWHTHDGGFTWRPLTFSFPPPLSQQAFVSSSSLSIFDESHGALIIHAADYHPQTTLYVTQTSDGGKTWSTPQPILNCAACGTQLFSMDANHWMAYDKAFFISSDAGATWRPTTPTITAKNMSAVEVIRSAPGTVVVLEPGVFASMSTDWGGHWRRVGLPEIYQSYRGLNGSGGWPWCCI